MYNTVIGKNLYSQGIQNSEVIKLAETENVCHSVSWSSVLELNLVLIWFLSPLPQFPKFWLCHTVLTFIDPKEEGSVKTLWEKEKMLVTSIFPFPTVFLAHLSTECSVSYCDHSPSGLVRPLVCPTSVCSSTIFLFTLFHLQILTNQHQT